MKNHKFGLFTAICMIVGIVIGSGIFFKSDNVLVYTNGNVMLGVIVFVLAAMAIIFGSLAMSELVIRTNKTGGIIAYAEHYLGKRVACVFGWFQTFVYYPTIIAVVSYVVGVYFCILFGFSSSLELEIGIGFICFLILHIINYLSTRWVGYFQNLATILKLLPIFLIILMGLFFGNPDFSTNLSNTTGDSQWIAAIGPIAFSYDGWIVATGLSHEIKNSHRNLPLALIIAPVFILCTYVLYFIGVCILVGPEQIMMLGDAHVDVAANLILGNLGSKIFLIFVIISVLGTVNGLTLGSGRGLYALGLSEMIPGHKKLSKISTKLNTPVNAIITSFIIATIWMVVHYLTTKYNVLQNSDISEIDIVTMYLFYILLYIQVMKLKELGKITSVMRGYIIPSLAIIGSLSIFFGGMQNSMFWLYTIFSIIIILISYSYARRLK
ncbi:MAG: APC family permease [Coprobacillaceae bacterium]